MKASETFRKANPLKSYQVQKAREQKSLQKYRVETLQGKREDKVYMPKVQNGNSTSDHGKNNRSLISISSSNIPVISSFEKKIRQAIQTRYQKSKIKEFKYDNQIDSFKNQDYEGQSFKSQAKNLISEESEKSEDMQEMKRFAYLRNESFVSIHQYHASKMDRKRQSTIFKEGIRKRKFKILNSKSIQAKQGFYSGHTNSIQKMPLNIEQELNSLSPKEPKPMRVDLKVLKSNLEEGIQFDEEKRKSLTQRQIDGHHQLTSFLNSDNDFNSIQPKNNLKNNSYIIKDTFKLKSANKLNKNKDQQQYVQTQSNPNPLNYSSQKSGRTENNKRRILLQTNQIKSRKIQTQSNQQSQKKLPLNYQSIPKTQNKKVFSSRKIQTEIIEQPRTIQKKTPAYINTKSKIKTQQTFLNDFQNNEGQMNHSSSQQKWKLEEISFRFKADNEQKTQFTVEKINNFIEQNQKALKMGFSLEKAYNKILSGRKIQRKQTPNFDNKRTIVPKNQKNLQRISTIVHQTVVNREERSLSKNKRRKLRLRTEADFEAENSANQGFSTVKNSKKNIETQQQNSSLIETQLKEPIKNSRDKQRREFLATNYRSKPKVDRFSTIS